MLQRHLDPVSPARGKNPQQHGSKTSKGTLSVTESAGDEQELLPLPCGPLMKPTPSESVDWVKRMQSFPTDGRSQRVMVDAKMGTMSCAEALPHQTPEFPSEIPHEGLERNTSNGGILVLTEVRREIIQDRGGQPYRGEDAISIREA